jgi:hypothetical protein
MPCYEPNQDDIARAEYSARCQRIEAVLCAVTTWLSQQSGGVYANPWSMLDEFMLKVDWSEVGVSKKFFQQWWKEHQQRDVENQRQKKQQARLEQRRQRALNKLTPRERRALGLKDK